MPVKILSDYRSWKPVFHSVIKDGSLAGTIHEKGYAVVPFLNDEQLSSMRELYQREHSIHAKTGGMFYSLYSKDLLYRKRVHETLGAILNPLLEEHFKDYKNIVNTFVIKASGPASEFYMHQDPTTVDEFSYSPLSVWIPLQDITPENGAVAVVEKSHWFFSPFRSITFAPPFDKISETVRQYLKPVYLKAGEALVFDPRLVHNSMPNVSGSDRLVVLCGVFPKKAGFIFCHKDKAPGSRIELISQDDGYALEHGDFYYNCHARPDTGTLVSTEEDDFPPMSAATFEELCAINNVEKSNLLGKPSEIRCQMIAEPDGINKPAAVSGS